MSSNFLSKRRVILVFVLLTNISFILSGEDFYKILDITREADDKVIKKAFRALSVKYHPDKNPGNPSAHEMFLKVNKAHEVLMDPEKRKIYDIYGEEGLEKQNLAQEHKQKGPNAKVDLHVELEDLYNGAVKEISLQKNIVCPKCRGTGGKLGKTHQCTTCGGRGVTMQDVNTGMGFTFRMQNTCPKCQGKGIVFTETCEHCRGRKVVREDKKIRVDIERGMKDNQNIVFERESEQHPDMIPGDLVVTVKQSPHKFFHSRHGDHLYADINLNLKEALLGYSKKITHLDGREFYVEKSDPTHPYATRKIDAEGMPVHNYPSHKGDLILKFMVRLPDRLSDVEKELVRQLFE